jgi:hypothetical protein
MGAPYRCKMCSHMFTDCRCVDSREIRQAFLDIMEGQFKSWQDVQNHTGLSQERCEDIYALYVREINK